MESLDHNNGCVCDIDTVIYVVGLRYEPKCVIFLAIIDHNNGCVCDMDTISFLWWDCVMSLNVSYCLPLHDLAFYEMSDWCYWKLDWCHDISDWCYEKSDW